MAKASAEVEQLHFLLIPLMSQSHIIPLTDFAKLLARQGPVVSIITTPLNAIRYKSIVDHASRSNLKIQLIPIEFPGKECGLPEGCENMDALPSPNLARHFFDACSLLQDPIEILAKKLVPKPSCIVSTSALPWTQSLAQNLSIPRYVFHTVSCFTLLCSDILSKTKVHEEVSSDSDTFFLPDTPHRIEFTKSQLPESMRKNSDDLKSVLEHMKQVESQARGYLINSFEELDPWYVEHHKKIYKNFWCIGPVCLSHREMEEKIGRGNKTAVDENYCLKWLDSKEPRSVIYTCFGSLCRLTPTQLKEIGRGLEASNRPFIWIIRDSDYSREVDKWLKEDKYEERIKGIVIKGWAPQVLILSHSAIGGFLTHCGWNSTMEGICAGVPMITWPMFAEQFYNEKFVVNVLRIGVRVGVKEGMKFGEEENKDYLVKGEKIAAAVNELMDDGEEGEAIRKTARELSEKAKRAIEEGGSSYVNTTLLIQDVLQQKGQLKVNCFSVGLEY
ncbi:OLC1v1034424C1 [Oldenlandia corymbosa var. corymbosa]|uniref:Glycosyltransferase n=1 Tax=Oldenlandia corymbosa var. corymbosa TaxID=529605 RepID=A0AAV1CS87_OLDCO|nr:OLC1v1034424C1 [Oldenlandia corymbosa var. corymbosa]